MAFHLLYFKESNTYGILFTFQFSCETAYCASLSIDTLSTTNIVWDTKTSRVLTEDTSINTS